MDSPPTRHAGPGRLGGPRTAHTSPSRLGVPFLTHTGRSHTGKPSLAQTNASHTGKPSVTDASPSHPGEPSLPQTRLNHPGEPSPTHTSPSHPRVPVFAHSKSAHQGVPFIAHTRLSDLGGPIIAHTGRSHRGFPFVTRTCPSHQRFPLFAHVWPDGRGGRCAARTMPRRLGAALFAAILAVIAIGFARFDVANAVSSPPADAPVPQFSWPLGPPHPVLRPFTAPATPYGPGHRGVDLGGTPGEPVFAAAGGVVVFAGELAGRGVVSIDHAGGLRTTYEPLAPAVAAGEQVVAGTVIGQLQAGHPGCAAAACLHWGVRRGAEYLDPLTLVLSVHVRLLPWEP